MKKIVHYKPSMRHYTADACVIWCFDDRFSELLEKFKKRMRFKKIDLLKIAGGAKVFATPDVEWEEKYLLDQIAKSIKLHHAQKIILMAHSECGAYGKKFKSAKPEQKFYIKELKKAKRTVDIFFRLKKIKKPIETYYADFSGLWRV